MNKLKTLQDLEMLTRKEAKNSFIITFQLKEEVIKWIKEINRNNFCDDEISCKNILHQREHGKIEFIKHFFNITEEDLRQ